MKSDGLFCRKVRPVFSLFFQHVISRQQPVPVRQFHAPLMGENILDDNAWNGPVLFPECFILDPVFIAADALAS